jgi:CD63 antigen
MSFIKYILFIFNLIMFIAGIVLIGVGVAIQTAFKSYFAFFGNEVNSAAIFLIIIGLVVIVVSFFGCCGAYKENHCMVVTFSVLLGAVFILEISAAIAAFLLRYQIENVLRDQVNKSLKIYGSDASVTKAWNEVQDHLECCGADNYTDWSDIPSVANTSSVPDTCCINPSPGCGTGVFKTNRYSNIYMIGCTTALLDLGHDKIYILGGVALGIAFFQLVGVIIACCLAAALRKENYQPMQ